MSAPSRAITRISAATQELWRIAETGDASALEMVLQRDADINAHNANGVTALMRAAAAGNEEFVRKLVEHGADINAHRDDGFNPLLLATFFGHIDTVRALVEYGADLNSTTRCGNSPEQWARARAFDDIAVYLQEARQTRSTPTINYFKQTVERPNPPKPVVVEGVFREQTKPASISTLEPLELLADDENEVESLSARPPEVRTLKDPPEIWDLVHSAPPQFNPGTAFVSRLTSSWTKRILLGLFLCLVAGGSVYAFLKYRGGSITTHVAPVQSVQTQAPQRQDSSARSPSAGATESQINQPGISATNDSQATDTGTSLIDGSVPVASASSSTRFSRRRKNVSAVISEKVSGIDEDAKKPQAVSPVDTATSNSTDAQSKKKADTGLSPQLIGPAKSGPTPKPKVIQWP